MASDLRDLDLSGLIDLHIHSAPDVVPRFADDVETARAAAAAGLRAIMIKSHVTLTADRASLAEKAVPGIRVLGGLALNEAVGGINPRAVEVALRMGAKQIWLPTFDAANHRRHHGEPGGLSVWTEDGRIRPALCEILDLVREGDAILGTGHLSAEETLAVVALARERGVRKILVTHPEAPFIRLSPEAQEALRREGVFFERCFVFSTMATGAPVSVAEIAAQIRRVGIESTVLSTDLGQAGNPSPPAGLRSYLADLLGEGFTWGDLRIMAGENPSGLLGL